jgi:hypothetical protein
MKMPFEIKITDVGEVRMGSPYNSCYIELVGFHKLKISSHGWQDKFAWSEDSEKLVLIKWNFENNQPGFHIFSIETETGKTKESERIIGLPNSFSILDNKVKLNKFLYNKEKSKTGNLCCNIDEEYEL